MSVKRVGQGIGLFGGAVHHDQAIHAGVGGLLRKGLIAAAQQRIEVAHQDDRRIAILGAKTPYQSENRLHRRAVVQSAKRGALDRRTVRHGIGEGNAQFDQVRARAG